MSTNADQLRLAGRPDNQRTNHRRRRNRGHRSHIQANPGGELEAAGDLRELAESPDGWSTPGDNALDGDLWHYEQKEIEKPSDLHDLSRLVPNQPESVPGRQARRLLDPQTLTSYNNPDHTCKLERQASSKSTEADDDNPACILCCEPIKV